MRLLNTTTEEARDFLPHDVPRYAILSHTWGEEEVTFQHLESKNFQHLKGYPKLHGSCRVARTEGYDWIWIDTCCIDKTSSAELSEAINSMFVWYRDSDVCYAYLGDVTYNVDDPPSAPGRQVDGLERALRKSRWFRRGWTLQELVAPSIVVFLNAAWSELGTKASLGREIAAITGIDHDVLGPRRSSVRAALDQCSIAQRMSWAWNRKTTRLEDMAYCLLGIFDVNMPLLYGEGDKAFFRLQKEILNQVEDDMTIFVWAWPSGGEGSRSFSGLLAHSPMCFRGYGDVRPYPIKGDKRYDLLDRRDGKVTKNLIQLFLRNIYPGFRISGRHGISKDADDDDDGGLYQSYNDLTSLGGMKIPNATSSTQRRPRIVLLDCWTPAGQVGLLMDYAERCWYLSRHYPGRIDNKPILLRPADLPVPGGMSRESVDCALILKETSMPLINPLYREVRVTMPICQYGYFAREVRQLFQGGMEDTRYVLLKEEEIDDEYGTSFDEFDFTLLLLSLPPPADGNTVGDDAEMPPFLLACFRTAGAIAPDTSIAVDMLRLEHGSQEELETAEVIEWCERVKDVAESGYEQTERQMVASQTRMSLSARFDLVIKNRPSPEGVQAVVLLEETAS